MANFHCSIGMISRSGGKSTVAAVAYRTGTVLLDERTGEVWDYTKKSVGHVDILTPDNAPQWASDISELCKTDKKAAIQKLSIITEAAERRKDSQVYREIEFSLPNELTNEQNIKWANAFIRDTCVKHGMLSITNFHFDYDEKKGIHKPHCHAVLLTRELTEKGLGEFKQRNWNEKSFVRNWREQCAAYQNEVLKENGFETRVDHRSYEDRGITDIEAQPKLGKNALEMEERGIQTDKKKAFDIVKLKNQFQVLKNPELVFSIVTSNHSTFTSQDIAKVLNRYIDDPQQFQTLYHRLLNSKNLICVAEECKKEGKSAIYTTRQMLTVEMELVEKAEILAAQKTHPVDEKIIDKVIDKQNKIHKEHGGLSLDQQNAIRHMLGAEQLSCVVGFAGSGKTTSLTATNEAWSEMGYDVIGVAPTGKAADAMEGSGIRSMTLHKFLRAQHQGREQIDNKTVLVLDEAGMVDSRRCHELISVIERSGAKWVKTGDGAQTQSVEAGPAFRLITDHIKPAVLETIVRQKIEWQRHASRLFGQQETRKALEMYHEHGAFKRIQEKELSSSSVTTVERYCLARQMSGRIWQEMVEDVKQSKGITGQLDVKQHMGDLQKHQDYVFYKEWQETRKDLVQSIMVNFSSHRDELAKKGADLERFDPLAKEAKAQNNHTKENAYDRFETELRKFSYSNTVDTREQTKKAMVDAWVKCRQEFPNDTHLMLAFMNRDSNDLNISARILMRQEGAIQGQDFVFTTQSWKQNDFGNEIIKKADKSFAQGDRLLFTKNDTGLGVRNGTLGTIIEISKNNIKVSIDEQKGDVSFSPNVYPFIDNGWATTIHKAQGATADHTKKLDAFEEYQNLAYVGMTRHRRSLETFGSTLDFWREEKAIDRLSRVQEKLSGLDYLDYGKAFEQLKSDEKIIWHEQKIQQGKDLFNAIKITGRSVLDVCLNRPREKIVDQDKFLSFDNSEEKRSAQLFTEKLVDTEKSQQPNSEKSDVTSQSIPIKPLITRDISKTQTGNQTKTVIVKSEMGINDVKEKLIDNLERIVSILNDKPIRENTSEHLRIGEKNGSLFITTSGDYRGRFIDYSTSEKGNIFDLISYFKGGDFVDSLKWGRDFLGGVYNDQVKTVNIMPKTDVPGKTSKDRSGFQRIFPVPQNMDIKGITAEDINTKDEFKDVRWLSGHGRKIQSIHEYRTQEGDLNFYIVRTVNSEGKDKKPYPLMLHKDEDGKCSWQGFGLGGLAQRPLFGLDQLGKHPDRDIIMTEGEKSATAAQKLFPHLTSIAWSGGSGAVALSDYSPLKGKNVVFWPDNDTAGLIAADKLLNIIKDINKDCEKKPLVSAIDIKKDLPANLEETWDLADKFPKGFTKEDALRLINKGLGKTNEAAQNIEKTQLIQHNHLKEGEEIQVYFSKDEYVAQLSLTKRTVLLEKATGLVYEHRGVYGSMPDGYKANLYLSQADYELKNMEKNMRYSRVNIFKEQNGQKPTAVDEPKVIEIATRMAALEGRIYRESIENKEPKTAVQIFVAAREQLEAFDKHEMKLAQQISDEYKVTKEVAQLASSLMTRQQERMGNDLNNSPLTNSPEQMNQSVAIAKDVIERLHVYGDDAVMPSTKVGLTPEKSLESLPTVLKDFEMKQEATLIKNFALQGAALPDHENRLMIQQKIDEKTIQMQKVMEMKIQGEMIRHQENQQALHNGLER